MKLYYKPGACSLAPHIVLHEIDQAVDLVKTDTATGETESGERFAEISPNGYVPALRLEDGGVITENPAILQYLADRAPRHHLAPPNGTFERVRLQELLNFLSSELHKAFSPFFAADELSGAARTTAEARLARRIAEIERRLGDGRAYLLGDGYTVADAYAFVLLNWAGFVGIDLAPWPKTEAFVARVRARPATLQALASEGLTGGMESAA